MLAGGCAVLPAEIVPLNLDIYSCVPISSIWTVHLLTVTTDTKRFVLDIVFQQGTYFEAAQLTRVGAESSVLSSVLSLKSRCRLKCRACVRNVRLQVCQRRLFNN